MPAIEELKPVSLREAWPNEALHFTPWLAEHIGRLTEVLNMRLERVQREETLPGGAGRVDIRARQAETDAIVVIENQLGESDDSHCLRLLGYAANAEANILVWVARSFTSYHRSIMKWLNEADTIDVYAVAVRAYRVGEALAADFQTVVEPRPSVPEPGPKTATTRYAEFYRPLAVRLRRSGVLPVGKGGYRGRWRSFQTGHAGAIYGTEFEDGKGMVVFVSFHGTDRQVRFRALHRHREAIDGEVGGNILWNEKHSLVTLRRNKVVRLTAPEEELEIARQWMACSLLSLRDAVQPYLDDVMGARDTASKK